MASAFSHIAIPVALRLGLGKELVSKRLVIFGFVSSILPDLDVIAFRLGVAYQSPWGHRGFSHSIVFALIFSLLAVIFYKKLKATRSMTFIVTFISMISHGFLDALTNGGLGVAFLWPLTNERYFFPWNVVEVSPLGLKRFFGAKGLSVLKSEFVYIWLPCLSLSLCLMGIKNLKLNQRK